MRNSVFILLVWLLFHNLDVSAQDVPVRISGIPRSLSWENRPLEFTQSASGFTIVAGPKTDMFRDPNAGYNTDNAPRLLFLTDSNFVLSCTIEHDFINKWDGGAIVLKQDSVNWIKFCFEKDYTGAKRVVSVVTKNISDDCNSVAVVSSRIHYRIARAGKVITLYCSIDGRSWLLVRHLQFEAGELKLGFLAQSPTGNRCSVRFTNISYQARKIHDPYTGE